MTSPASARRAGARYTGSLAICLLAVASIGARQAVQTAAKGVLETHTVASAALQANLLGDPAESKVTVYLPPGYAASTKRYPTLYLLHGYYGNDEVFTRGQYGVQLEATMNALSARGLTREMIVVAPTGRNAYFGSFYANSPVTGGWEDFVSSELVRWVDGRYRTLARPESRGIAGHSMGGYGAIMLAMKHPDVFSALYALSPCCVGFEGDMGPDNPAWVQTMKVTGRDQLTASPKSLGDFFSTVFVAIAAVFSPNPAKGPLYVDLPFALRNDRIEPNEDAYTRWRARMPLYLVEQYRTNLRKLRGIALDYGEFEEFSHIRIATRAFSEELASRGVAHSFEVYAGGDHSNKIRERFETRVVRFFSEVLSAE